jgi:hypothetical protein
MKMKKNLDTKPDSCPLQYKLTYPHKTRLTPDNNMIADNNMGTGYCTYKLRSKPNRGTIIVPEEYDRKAGLLMELTREIESKRKNIKGLREIAEDVLYLTICKDLADEDVKYNENGPGKQDAINKSKFFRKILESIV